MTISQTTNSRGYRTHLTYVGKKSHDLSIRLKGWAGNWTEHGVHNNLRIIGELNVIEQAYAMISGIGGQGLGREKLVDFKFVGALFSGQPFQHHRPSVRYSSCVHP